ncbi:hypothetical protein SADO_12263 [Salinisphaera dokdonensis CL-ES53]|uniref:Uncharacterized protein n=1 Tax=Salinisphaera dokdonensis CL-ES53 TaxID=1304272 RepID=A0ABV2B2D1_9GAMM
MRDSDDLRQYLGVPAEIGPRLDNEELRAIYQGALSRLDTKFNARQPASALLEEFVGDERDVAIVKLVEHLFAPERDPLPAWLELPSTQD